MSCPECFSGHVHEGDPRGTIIKLHGLDTYATEPTSGAPIKGIIVVIPDALGWEFVNNRILADHYADKGGYKVYLPNFMNGNGAPPELLDSLRLVMGPGNLIYKPYHIVLVLTGILPWRRANGIPKTHSRVKDFFTELRTTGEGASLPIFTAGFCWGGKHALLLAHDGVEANGRPLVDAVFTGHPSMLDMPGDFEKLVRPVSVAVGDGDNHINPAAAEQIMGILEGLPEGAKGELRVYEKCAHGFCIRADVKFEDVAKAAAEAEDQCIAWFDKHLQAAA
ncbi:dienelactone hydrolase family protein [Trichodelitschia bisporula]|uniref:Dienelactone hydrolase family protein n=1 Tax=Trichodelitschia bisporula TaxID=703511 RepID=A0A6G1HYY1_9PEZI|nr:dienelactone hydrolase family protein [Trichodelitschia bisporula]